MCAVKENFQTAREDKNLLNELNFKAISKYNTDKFIPESVEQLSPSRRDSHTQRLLTFGWKSISHTNLNEAH